MITHRRTAIFKTISKWKVALLLTIWSFLITISAHSANTLAPVYPLLLDETRLDQTLAAYDDPSSKHVFVAAHRGGRESDAQDAAPGNSIANIDNAVSKGFDLYESDIEILGDGTLVVFHDNTFDDLTDSSVPNDLLDNATLAYAKTLRLNYTDGTISNEQIPTLEEFLNAAKGKIMLKFDLKSGTFKTSTLLKILSTVVATDTVDQVLIRGGDNLLSVAANNGYDTRMIMRRYNSPPSAQDIQSLATTYDLRGISIPNGAPTDVIDAANAEGLVVEIHESQDAASRELLWQDAIRLGYRQFHSFSPGRLLDYLNANGYREF